MRRLPLILTALLAALTTPGCDQQTGGAAGPAPAPAQPATGAAEGAGAAAPPTAAPTPAAPAPTSPAAPAAIDWSTVAPAPERDARLALYGIIRQIDLKRYEDTGWDIVSYDPASGPTDRLANVFSPVTVLGDTFAITPSHWLAICDLAESWPAQRGENYMARPMPDARYGDGETSTRGNLVFAIVVEDAAEKTLKFVWSPQ